MRLEILLFVSASLALRLPRIGQAAVSVKTTPSSTSTSSTSDPITSPRPSTLATSVSTVQSSSCTPKSICADYRDACGNRYGGCYDKNYCDGNTSPFPIPACATPAKMVREVVSEPRVTSA